MEEGLKTIEDLIDQLALEIINLDEGDILGLGKAMNLIETLEDKGDHISEPNFGKLLKALKRYVEKLILAEETDVDPLERGVGALQAVLRAVSRGESYDDNLSAMLSELGRYGLEESNASDSQGGNGSEAEQGLEEQGQEEREACPEFLSDEDQEVMADFVVEALENLGTIEVNLVELEHDPSDADIINAIFRPFHTIKGVSGFLNLAEINKLSHCAENLLDLARSGELSIDADIIDIILESVDMLKKMIENVKVALEVGRRPSSNEGVGPLIARIQDVISASKEHKDKPLGELLVEKGAIDREEMERVLEEQKKDGNKKVGEILVEKGLVGSKEVISALREQKRVGKKKIDLQVKVDTKKLDTLVDMTGELVIAQSMLRQNKRILSVTDQRLFHALNQLHQISSMLQKTAMSMRMVPIKNTFQKMVRLVRDLARSSGKKVSLEMKGEETEIDRNVVEELYEPMVHMIRNAVDHGIEPPEQRLAKGKPEKGTIELLAYQRGGSIIIEIRDDGRGLDKEKILSKAIDKGIISGVEQLSESEIYNLIFKPGFSTSETVTEISGRGVGMDVVKKALEKLRGRVEIKSKPDKGSTFIITLPLTLAIIDGIIVRVAEQRYIIPALGILKSFRPNPNDYSTVEGKGEMIMVRGELVPLVRLHHLFELSERTIKPWEGLAVLIGNENEKLCLLVDELVGKEEVVIKTLGEALKNVKGLAGGAILGDGRVGLILDIPGLFAIAKNSQDLPAYSVQKVA